MKTDLTYIIVSLLKKELEEHRVSKEQDSYGIKALIADLEVKDSAIPNPGLPHVQEQYQKRVLSMNVNLDLLGIQVVERAKRMKRDKSNDYIEGFDNACNLLLEYQNESLELTRHDQDNK